MRPRILGEKWKNCDRCGFTLPESYLRTSSKGRLLCNKCWDANEDEASGAIPPYTEPLSPYIPPHPPSPPLPEEFIARGDCERFDPPMLQGEGLNPYLYFAEWYRSGEGPHGGNGCFVHKSTQTDGRFPSNVFLNKEMPDPTNMCGLVPGESYKFRGWLYSGNDSPDDYLAAGTSAFFYALCSTDGLTFGYDVGVQQGALAPYEWQYLFVALDIPLNATGFEVYFNMMKMMDWKVKWDDLSIQ